MENKVLLIQDSKGLLNDIRSIIKEELNEISLIKPPLEEKTPYIKIDNVCEIFHVSKPTVYDWIKKGMIQF